MLTRIAIAALVFMMTQAVLFGVGVTAVLATPLAADADELLPVVVALSVLLALPFAWWLAPRLRARYWERPRHAPADRIIADLS